MTVRLAAGLNVRFSSAVASIMSLSWAGWHIYRAPSEHLACRSFDQGPWQASWVNISFAGCLCDQDSTE